MGADVDDREVCLERLKGYSRESFLMFERKSNYQGLEGSTPWKARTAKIFGDIIAEDIEHYWNPNTEFGSAVCWKLTDPLAEALCDGDDIMLVSHSLGTMISYDVLWKFSYYGENRALRQHEIKVNRFVTLGSPLGDETVKVSYN